MNKNNPDHMLVQDNFRLFVRLLAYLFFATAALVGVIATLWLVVHYEILNLVTAIVLGVGTFLAINLITSAVKTAIGIWKN